VTEKMGKTIKLSTKEAPKIDVGRSIVRLSSKSMEKLGAQSGSVVLIKGKKEAVGVAWRGLQEDEIKEIIRLDGILRSNTGVGLDEEVEVSVIEPKSAKKIVLSPTQAIQYGSGFIEYVQERLLNKPFIKNNKVLVDVMGTPLTFIITNTAPSGVIMITEETTVAIGKKPVEEKGGVPMISYEDIGGLREEIETIREMIEVPMKYPQVFKKLGVSPPKGVLLYGPPGTGKTLLAKAVASETEAHFIHLAGPEIMCVGAETPMLVNGKISTAEEVFAHIEKSSVVVEKTKNRTVVKAPKGFKVFSVNGKLKVEEDEIVEATRLDAKESLLLETSKGTKLHISQNQPFGVLEKGKLQWKRANELKQGDYVACARSLPLKDSNDLPFARAGFMKPECSKSNFSRANAIKVPDELRGEFTRFLGAMFAEGHIAGRMDAVYFANNDARFKDEIVSTLKNVFGLNGGTVVVRDDRVDAYSKALAEFLCGVGLPKGRKREMHVPPFLFDCDEELVSAFASGYFDGDGTVSYSKEGYPTPRFYSVNKEFLEELGGLLQVKLSMPSKVTPWKTPYCDLWALVVSGRDGRKIFEKTILDKSLKKRDWKLLGKLEGEGIVPNIAPLLKTIKVKLGFVYGKTIKESSIEPYISGRKKVTRRKLRELYDIFKSRGDVAELRCIKEILDSDVAFDKVIKIEKIGEAVLYDFGIKKNSNFAGGLPFVFLHNSKWYGQSEENLRNVFKEAQDNAPSIIFIDEIDAIAPAREEVSGEVEKRVVSQLLTLMDGLEARGEVVVIAATNRPEALDPALRRPGRFDREVQIGIPDRKGRMEILQIHSRGMPLTEKVDLDMLADITHGYSGADLNALVKEAAMRALRRVMPEIKKLKDEELTKEILDKIEVTEKDFEEAMRKVEPSAMREVLVEIPKIKWNDIGGLKEAKEELIESVEWPLKHAKVFKEVGISAPRGILLYGPPGTGKTLLAKAVANESEANFISVKGPELLNKYVGESERGVRKIFKRARQVAPSIIFFDEIESLTGTRGMGMDSSGVKESVVAQLLSEIDGVSELKDVVLIGATNRPDLIDTALIRPGRFEKLIYVPMPDTEARIEIFKVHTKNVKLDKDVKLEKLVIRTEGYSGADIEAIVRKAGMLAVKDVLDKKTKEAMVDMSHFEKALKIINPSVTSDDHTGYWKRNKETARGGNIGVA